MKKITFLLLVLLLFVASSATADNYKAYVSGRDLIERCDTENMGTASRFIFPNCMGYIAATIDTHESLIRSGASSPIFCKPEGHDLTEMHKIVCKYLNENSDSLLNNASELILKALAEIFPCVNQSASQPKSYLLK